MDTFASGFTHLNDTVGLKNLRDQRRENEKEKNILNE